MPFTVLPNPPPPLGIDQWPVPPAEQVCWKESLPDAEVSLTFPNNFKLPLGKLTNQTLTVYGQYTALMQATVTPQTSPLTQKVSVTTGTSTTVSESTSISLSFGVSIPGLFDLGTKIDETVGFSQTWTASQTTEDDFTVTSTKGPLSAIWWQGRYRYVFNATGVPGGIWDQIFLTMIGNYPKEMILNTPTYVSSQYPHDGSMSLTVLRGRRLS